MGTLCKPPLSGPVDSHAQLGCCRSAIEIEGVKALFHLGSVCGGVVLSILSRRTDGIRLPARLPWLVPVLTYCFFLSFTSVRSTAPRAVPSTHG